MTSHLAKLTATLLTLCLCCYGPASVALQRGNLSIEQLNGAGWSAEQLQIALQITAQPIRAQIKASTAVLTGMTEPIRDLVIDCLDVQLLADHFACAQARISGTFPFLGKQQWLGDASYSRNDGSIQLNLHELTFADGKGQLQIQLHDTQWRAKLGLQNADITKLLQLAQRFAGELKLDAKGKASVELSANGNGATPQHLQWQVRTDALTLNAAAGTIAAEALIIDTNGRADAMQTTWQFDAHVNAKSGQAYVEPIFVDLGKYPLNVELQGRWDGAKRLQLQQLQAVQQDVINANAQGELQWDAANPVPQLQLHVDTLTFPGSFATYLQPFLLDTAFKNLNTSGTMQGDVAIRDTAPSSVDVQLQTLHVDDGSNNLRFEQIGGEIHWRNALVDTDKPPSSLLSWRSGSLLGLELGATQLPLELWDTNVRIAAPTRIPIFNGALAVDAFRVRKAGTPQMAFMLDAAIEPINVAQISRAFGWPEFGGELSGNITKLRMEDGVLTLGATLTAQVFSGTVSISDMRLEGALTQWPRFNANIAMNNLDLEQVTQAFSFGRITGRLSGEINQLSLFNWQPESFDAHLYTPQNDRSKHRISQRAVQNIGSVGGNGGGVAAALQSGFLKFFDDFNYDQLGISCRLVNDVCLISGVAPAKNGSYYLVKGRGLPRIDVIGNATRVDWPRLLAQLKAATESEGPVVK